jgi:hypothetical protein
VWCGVVAPGVCVWGGGECTLRHGAAVLVMMRAATAAETMPGRDVAAKQRQSGNACCKCLLRVCGVCSALPESWSAHWMVAVVAAGALRTCVLVLPYHLQAFVCCDREHLIFHHRPLAVAGTGCTSHITSPVSAPWLLLHLHLPKSAVCCTQHLVWCCSLQRTICRQAVIGCSRWRSSHLTQAVA